MVSATEPLLLDTDVLIDYLRGRADAVSYINPLTNPLFLSVITVAELYAGVRDGTERTTLDEFVSAFFIVPVDHEIAARGGLIRRDFGKSHGTGLADALIAATAELQHLVLVTLNGKHFPSLASVVTPY